MSRRYRFAASHRLHADQLSAESNREMFGKCNNPFGHGHNYIAQFTFAGPVDEQTGMVTNLADLDAFAGPVLEPFRFANLNTLPCFAAIVPSTENLCAELWKRFIVYPHAKLVRVRVEETGSNAFDYSGEAAALPAEPTFTTQCGKNTTHVMTNDLMSPTKQPVESPSPQRNGQPPAEIAERAAAVPLAEASLQQIYAELIHRVGEDPARNGLLHTPERMEKALHFLTRGYRQSVSEVVHEALFDVDYDEMVIVKDVDFFSLCEHHLLPFFGRAHVAYVPNGKVIGLSKIPRIVDVFARRLQVQERLTQQIAEAVQEIVQPQGVAVVIEAQHLCMMMRGVEKQGSSTVTSSMLGVFKSSLQTRNEFLSLIKPGRG